MASEISNLPYTNFRKLLSAFECSTFCFGFMIAKNEKNFFQRFETVVAMLIRVRSESRMKFSGICFCHIFALVPGSHSHWTQSGCLAKKEVFNLCLMFATFWFNFRVGGSEEFPFLWCRKSALDWPLDQTIPHKSTGRCGNSEFSSWTDFSSSSSSPFVWCNLAGILVVTMEFHFVGFHFSLLSRAEGNVSVSHALFPWMKFMFGNGKSAPTGESQSVYFNVVKLSLQMTHGAGY